MIFPETLEQLCAEVRTAAGAGRALVPVSSKGPHLHGASENGGAETVSFERMNEILKISRHDRYARVQAGVTFGQLLPALKENGLRANHPFLPRAGKSVVASLLEREAVLVPKYQYDYMDPLLTAEVVYGTGDVFRTGSAAGPGPVEELKADMVNPFGPGAVDFARFLTGAQGTMGLVTWATLKAEVAPTESALFFIESKTLAPLTDLAVRLLYRRIPDDCVILSAASFAAAFGDSLDEEALLRAKAAPWTMLCRVSGYERDPAERVAIYSGYLREEAEKASLTPLCEPSCLPGFASRADAALRGCDRRPTYWKLRRGAVRELLFLAPPSRTPELTDLLLAQTAGHGATDRSVIVQPQVQGRAFRVECGLFCAPDALEKTRALASEAETALFRAGAYFDRPYSAELCRLVYAVDPVSTNALKKLKAIFDPAGIFNPGRLCF